MIRLFRPDASHYRGREVAAEGQIVIYLLALLIGVVAGLRALTAPAAVAIGAVLAWIYFEGTTFAFMASPIALAIFIALAVAELISDKLPRTPSRLVPPQFALRVLAGAFAGAVLAVAPTGQTITAIVLGLLAGGVGAVIGTLGGARLRAVLARALGADRPAALTEDALAILGGLLIVYLA